MAARGDEEIDAALVRMVVLGDGHLAGLVDKQGERGGAGRAAPRSPDAGRCGGHAPGPRWHRCSAPRARPAPPGTGWRLGGSAAAGDQTAWCHAPLCPHVLAQHPCMLPSHCEGRHAASGARRSDDQRGRRVDERSGRTVFQAAPVPISAAACLTLHAHPVRLALGLPRLPPDLVHAACQGRSDALYRSPQTPRGAGWSARSCMVRVLSERCQSGVHSRRHG